MSIVQINLLTVPEGMGPELEKRFANRARAVDGTPGFEGFDLLRPTSGEGNDKYMVLTRWESQEAFEAWVESRAFQQGHANAGGGQPTEEAKKAHAHERREEHAARSGEGGGHQAPAATDSLLWGFDVVDLDGLLAEQG